jgi:hypothetical protein
MKCPETVLDEREGRRSGFTPGPWRWTDGTCTNPRHVYEYSIEHPRVIGEREYRANARLIAEAPAMYEALRLLMTPDRDYLAVDAEKARAILRAVEPTP